MENDPVLLSAHGATPAVQGGNVPGAPCAESEDGVDDHLEESVFVDSAGFCDSSSRPRALTPFLSSSSEIGA